MVFSWYLYKVWELDCHETSVKVFFHGTRKSGFSNITMRNMERRGYHGRDVKVILVECHEMMRKEFCHGNDKRVIVKKYHEEVVNVFFHGKGEDGSK